MSAPLTDAPARKPALPVVDQASVDDFIAACGRTAVLFFRGDAIRYPESADIAVILPELVAAFPGRLTAAEVAEVAERALMRRFGVAVCPSLVLARGDRTLGVIAKLQDWPSYLARIGAILAEADRPAEPELQR